MLLLKAIRLMDEIYAHHLFFHIIILKKMPLVKGWQTSNLRFVLFIIIFVTQLLLWPDDDIPSSSFFRRTVLFVSRRYFYK